MVRHRVSIDSLETHDKTTAAEPLVLSPLARETEARGGAPGGGP